MTHEQALRARQKLLDRLPLTGEILWHSGYFLITVSDGFRLVSIA
jgi:hypothetical protein